jgi:acyl-homoserine lactone acylase PvdQ
LRPEQNATPELMKEMQLDNTNFLATMALPVLADLVKTNDANMLDKLKVWDGKYVKESTEATFFEEWWNAIETNPVESNSGEFELDVSDYSSGM